MVNETKGTEMAEAVLALGSAVAIALSFEAIRELTRDVAAQITRNHHSSWRGSVAIHLIKGDN